MENYWERNTSTLAKQAKDNELFPWRLYLGLFYLGLGLIMYFTSYKV